MTTTTDLSVITYPIAASAIAEKCERYKDLKIGGPDDKAGYQMVRSARLDLKADRVAIENRRKELKAGALEYGRQVDGTAKELMAPIVEREKQLQAEEDAHKAALAEIERKEQEAKRAKLYDRLEKLKEQGCGIHPFIVEEWTDEEFDKQLANATEASRVRKEAAEQERAERLERERLQQEAEEKLRQQQAEIAAREEALREEQRKLEEERQAREHAIRMEQERREAAENAARETEERIKREQAEAVERERQRQLEQERIAALRPDHEKLLEVADKVEALAGTVTVSKASIDLLSNVNKRIVGCAATIRHAVNQAMQNE